LAEVGGGASFDGLSGAWLGFLAIFGHGAGAGNFRESGRECLCWVAGRVAKMGGTAGALGCVTARGHISILLILLRIGVFVYLKLTFGMRGWRGETPPYGC
jgi:hypothetical protein